MNIKIGLKLSMFPLVLCMLLLSACGGSDTPKDVTNRFWEAVESNDMETAKELSTWDTVVYLEVLDTHEFSPERFELGEAMLGDTRAEIETTLYSSKLGEEGVKLPGVTALVKTDKGWKVNVKKSMAAVIKSSANSMFGQLNGLMQEGLKELDESLGDVVNELGNALEEGAEELKKEFEKPLFGSDK